MANASTEGRLDRIEQLLMQEAEVIRQLRQTQAEESERIRLAQEQESERIRHIREQDQAEFYARLEAYNQACQQEVEQIWQTQQEDRANVRSAITELRQAQAEEQKLISDLRTQQALLGERVAGIVTAIQDRHEAVLECGQVITETVEELRAFHRRQDRILDDLLGQQPPREGEP
ncbi:MAG: hypothetical protein Q6L68_15425 [Thermostichus sp. DG02_5_bins_236]